MTTPIAPGTALTYGQLMRPLDVGNLDLPPDQASDPLVLRFLAIADTVSRAEKVSDPATWSAAERDAWDRGDTVGFSHLRGYTEEEISQFLEFINMVAVIDTKYGPDTAISLSFLMHEETGRHEAQEVLSASWRRK